MSSGIHPANPFDSHGILVLAKFNQPTVSPSENRVPKGTPLDSFFCSGSSPQNSEPYQSSHAVDLRFEDHLSLFLIRPLSQAGQQFLDDGVDDEDTLTFGNAVVCEPRYVEAILRGAIDARLAVQS
jgi:hypothetical protein